MHRRRCESSRGKPPRPRRRPRTRCPTRHLPIPHPRIPRRTQARPGPPSPGPQISAEDDTSAQPPSDADGAAQVSASGNGDDAAARLTAMKMALDGSSRDEIGSELESKFGSGDRGALLDDVLARAGK